MIDHTECDHPRTSGARAKCRRMMRGDDYTPRERSPRQPKKQKGTPRDKDMQCDVCGVERIEIRGTDPITGVLISVGEKCSYMLKQSADITALD